MLKKLLFSLIAVLTFSTMVMAQGMSDDQVIEYVKSATASGKSQKQIVAELGSKGVTRAQAERIKKRMEENQGSDKVSTLSSAQAQERNRRSVNEDQAVNNGEMDIIATEIQDPTEVSTDMAARMVFGRNIFNSKNLTFAPSQNIATPENYKLGPGDEVIIDIWGTNQNTIRQTISPDGYINIPDIGLVYLNGMTVKEADNFMRQTLNKIYSGVDSDNPTSDIKLTLGQIRTIQINVMGEVAVPGTYSLSSLSSMFHALYKAGGVGKLGSLREIQLIRNGKKINTIDIYDFILNGKDFSDIRLQEGDVILVPTYDMLVDISGNVKRPMYYEMKNGETVEDIIKYAGEFTGDAYSQNIRMVRQNGKEYQVFTIDDTEFPTFKLMDGDAITVGAMLDRFENRVEVKGAVYRPGIYQFGKNVNTVKQLIEKAEGLMADAFMNRAVLHRQREDLSHEIIPIDIKALMNGTLADIPLKRNDVLYIPSIHDLEDIGSISISGEVARPGSYTFADNTTLEDLIIQAGGLKESASTVRVDVSRRLKDSKATEAGSEISKQYTFSIKDGYVVDGEQGFILQPYDQVTVRRSPGYKPQVNVSVEGEVNFEGSFALTNKSERLSDLVKKTGGFTNYAYIKGAKLMRIANEEERKRMQDVMKLMRREAGNANIDSLKLEFDNVYPVGIDLEKAIKNPGSDADIVLREGDRLIIPEYTNTIKVNGAVMMPNTVTYKEGKGLSYYIDHAGGYATGARKSKAFIIYMNGDVAKVKGKGKNMIEPGCEIVVPIKDTSKTSFWNVTNVLGIASSLGSLGLTAAAIANIFK